MTIFMRQELNDKLILSISFFYINFTVEKKSPRLFLI